MTSSGVAKTVLYNSQEHRRRQRFVRVHAAAEEKNSEGGGGLNSCTDQTFSNPIRAHTDDVTLIRHINTTRLRLTVDF